MTSLIFMAELDISILWGIPFILLLACIAIIPLIDHHFWDRHLWTISLAVFCFPMLAALLLFLGGRFVEKTLHAALEYVSFISILAALYVVSGGILIRGNFRGKPAVNAGILGFGAVIASFVGTTGASMLLIRPLLRANAGRKRNAHVVVFFIFLVSNIGGMLTPLGDPPLFLGYLQGVPFTWTMALWKEWAVAVALVLCLFFMLDTIVYRKDGPGLDLHSHDRAEPFRVSGLINVVLLLFVVGVIAGHGYMLTAVKNWPHFGPQEAGLAAITALSLIFMPVKHEVRLHNGFSWKPMLEVVFLFAAIFATMIPALHILEQLGPSLGLREPWQFFWSTGILSSFLDNAPTYLTMLTVAKSLNLPNDLGFAFRDGLHTSAAILAAISCGAVFMGANTYIGNGPNFMVRAIAAERGVKMPSFFGYMLYSGLILIPVFFLITFLFFV
jgi:Na+/H+ antiporter NhaD/arsenite permease-like protein